MELLLLSHGGGGRLILTAIDGKVGWGRVLGLHSAVGKRLEAHWRGGFTRGAVSTGAWLSRRGMAVRGDAGGGGQQLTVQKGDRGTTVVCDRTTSEMRGLSPKKRECANTHK
jgi:hypothetical protein